MHLQLACFLAYRGVINQELLKHVYCAAFPSFAPLYPEGISRLASLQVVACKEHNLLHVLVPGLYVVFGCLYEVHINELWRKIITV